MKLKQAIIHLLKLSLSHCTVQVHDESDQLLGMVQDYHFGDIHRKLTVP